MKTNRLTTSCLVLLGVFMLSCQQESQVYEWRGVDRTGTYPDEGLLKEWPEQGPSLVWEYEGVGNGYGSPVFTDDKFYIMGEADSLAWLYAFDLSGNFLWKSDFGREWVKNYNGSRCAPTIAGDLVYVTSGMGNIYCFDRHSGDYQWSVDMVNDLNGVYPLFGFSEAVAVDGDMVFCTPGGRDTNVVALNRFTSEIIWISAGVGERSGYNQPKVIRLENRNIFVTFSAYALMGFDTETGTLLWVHEQDNVPLDERKPGMGDTHANTILYEDGFIYYAAGDGNCGVKLSLSPDGTAIEEIWRNKDFDSYMGGIVKIGEYVYGCGSVGRDFKSIDAHTGVIADSLDILSGAVIAADGMLYYYNWRGEVMLIQANPDDMKVVSQFRMTKGDKQHFAHPVIHDGKLYVRHGNVLQAYSI